MKNLIFASILTLSLASCDQKPEKIEKDGHVAISVGQEKIKVLNFATFHMGSTSDATSVKFDKENKKNQKDAKEIATIISRFKPTVICVEVPVNENDELNQRYANYLNDPDKASTYYGEVGLVAFEVGRRNSIDRLYGIDHRMQYNYTINNELKNQIDSITFNDFQSNPFKSIPELNVFEEGLSLKEKLLRMNHPKFLDFLITANADILAYVGTENGFEGADEAAKYYQRNLRIYSNLNRLPLKKEDRVFILSGGSHTAFLNEFMKRSLKYEVVDTFDYLNQ